MTVFEVQGVVLWQEEGMPFPQASMFHLYLLPPCLKKKRTKCQGLMVFAIIASFLFNYPRTLFALLVAGTSVTTELFLQAAIVSGKP